MLPRPLLIRMMGKISQHFRELPEISHGTMHQIQRLMVARVVIGSLLLFIVGYFYFYPLPSVQRGMLLAASLVQILLLLAQWRLTHTDIVHGIQVGFQLLGDMLLVSILIFVTGGVDSPFTLLFGLLIIATGTQTQTMLSLTVALAASGCYLGSVYMTAWHHQHVITVNESLSILMQVSAFLLVGGVMAYMGRRQQQLLAQGSQAVRLHRKLKSLHDQVMATMHDGVLILDGSCYIADCNRAACSMLAEGDDIQGQSLPSVIQLPMQLKHFFEGDNQSICRCEYECHGRVLLLMATQMPEGDEQAKWLLSMVDITDFRQLEEKMAAHEKLAAMGRMAAMLAHEIRNPLQSIGQAVEILSRGQGHQRQEVGNMMQEEVQRLNHLVSDMLSYTKPLYPKPETVAISDVITTAIRQVNVQGGMNIHLDCMIDEIEIDVSHLRLVLDNLLLNAVQASHAKGNLRIRFDEAEHGQWKLEVVDAAGGIPGAIKSHLFEPFVSGKKDGTGLGLATVWQVCQANVWNVKVDDSQEKGWEKGAIFTVTGPRYVTGNDFEGAKFGQRITG